MLRGTRPLFRAAHRCVLSKRVPILPLATFSGSSTSKASRPSQQVVTASPLAFIRPSRYSTQPTPPTHGDKKLEEKVAGQKLESNPAEVSTRSSVRFAIEPDSTKRAPDDEDTLRGLKQDLRTFKETFALDSVPRESYLIGCAGTLPYLATSLTTMYLSWDLNTVWPSDSTFLNSIMISHDNAAHLLNLLEPIQVGFGAVIISFLGAIHWGLEYAEKMPSRERTTFRYGIGVLAPAVAWPTMMLPIEWALSTQFCTFIFLYFADARATTQGWAPPWYGTYRWVLTAIVGVAIVVSLIGRARIGEETHSRLSTGELRQTLLQGRVTRGEEPWRDWAKLEAEEKEKNRKEKLDAEIKRKKEEEEEEAAAAEARGQDKDGEENKEDGEQGGENDGQKKPDSEKKDGNAEENEKEKAKKGDKKE